LLRRAFSTWRRQQGHKHIRSALPVAATRTVCDAITRALTSAGLRRLAPGVIVSPTLHPPRTHSRVPEALPSAFADRQAVVSRARCGVRKAARQSRLCRRARCDVLARSKGPGHFEPTAMDFTVRIDRKREIWPRRNRCFASRPTKLEVIRAQIAAPRCSFGSNRPAWICAYKRLNASIAITLW
jgi:hypothetical protein